jgi:hypothetical protein
MAPERSLSIHDSLQTKTDAHTLQQRLGNESMRRFDCCALCLQRAREPLACGEGHLFCKECVYTDLRASVPSVRRPPVHFWLMLTACLASSDTEEGY